MNYKNISLTILLISITALTGCTQLRKPSDSFAYKSQEQRQTELRQLKSWVITGALSITHGKKREIARFKWVQNYSDYTITISGPLNIKSIRITGNPDQVELCHTTKKCIAAKTPEQLILNQLGWQLPISAIRYWILASPAPKTKIHTINFDQYGHITTLNQNGWQIKYTGFKQLAEKNWIDLPKLIELKNSELAIKLKIIDVLS